LGLPGGWSWRTDVKIGKTKIAYCRKGREDGNLFTFKGTCGWNFVGRINRYLLGSA
jgi:hypothetical protein